MYLRSVMMENFRQFKGRHSFPLAPGFNLIQGPNGTGKSNILYAILFGLYGRTHKGMVASTDLISFGEEYLEVSIEFENQGKRFQVWRRCGRDGKEAFSFSEWSDAQQKWVKTVTVASGKTDLKARVEQATGIREMVFERIVFAEQKVFYKIVSGGTENKDFMDNILHVLPLTFIKDAIHEMVPKKAEVEARAGLLAAHQDAIKNNEAIIARTRPLLESANQKRRESEAALATLKKNNQEFLNIDRALQQSRPTVDRLIALDNEAAGYKRAALELDGKVSAFQQQHGTREQLDGKIAGLAGTIDSKQRLREQLENSVNVNKAEEGRLDQAFRTCYDQIRKMEGLGGTSECPVCKQKVSRAHIEAEIGKQEAERARIKANLEKLAAGIGKLQAEIARVKGEADAAKAELDQVRALASELQTLIKTRDDNQKSAASKSAELSRLVLDFTPPFTSQVATFNAALGKALSLPPQPGVLDFSTTHDAMKQTLKVKIDEFTAEQERIGRDISDAASQAAAHAQTIAGAETSVKGAKEGIRKLKVKAIIENKVAHLDGIMADLIREFRERKVEQLNEYTVEWYKRLVSVPTFRDIRIDKEDYSVSVVPVQSIVSDGDFKDITKYASGGHETFVGIAERLALIEIFGTNFGVFDEITDNADKDNATNVIVELARSGEYLDQVVAVTHFEVGLEMACNIVQVVPVMDPASGEYTGWSKVGRAASKADSSMQEEGER